MTSAHISVAYKVAAYKFRSLFTHPMVSQRRKLLAWCMPTNFSVCVVFLFSCFPSTPPEAALLLLKEYERHLGEVVE